jgi:putative ABC transport system substrate-binding protein
MRRREFITLIGSAATWPLAAWGQQSRSFRIGYLAFVTGKDSTIIMQRLQELGYREGENVEFMYRSADGRPELLAPLAAELVKARPDVLISGFGTLPAKAAKAATSTTPIVFASVGDPVGAGLINSLNRPGANVTGVTSEASDVVGKRLQLFDDLLPSKGTVAVLMNPDTPFSTLALQQLKTAAAAVEQAIQVIEARSADQVLAGIAAAAKAGAAGILTLEDALLVSTRRQMAERAITTRLPIVYGSREFAEAGGLISYGVDRRQYVSSRRRVCRYDPQGRASRRVACGATNHVRACDQPQGCEGYWACDAGQAARARR